MPDYLVVLKVTAEELPFPNAASDVLDDLGIDLDDDQVVGVYPIQRENTKFCECDRSNDRKQISLGIKRGVTYGWTNCKKCNRPLKKWHHTPVNLLFDKVERAERLFVQWSPVMNNQHRNFIRKKHAEWLAYRTKKEKEKVG